MGINYYKDTLCLNVLAGSLGNAKEIYKAAEGHVEVGVLSSSYPDVKSAVLDMKLYMEILEGNLSVGLGAGNPNQWKAVAEIGKEVKAHHFNQIFPAVGYTRACVGNDECHINALVSPTGTPGLVKISTGPISGECEDQALVTPEAAIALIKDMGGNSIKFFPMGGLAAEEELKAVAAACAKTDFILEPTGGITMDNYREILTVILDAGVKKVIPHVYSSIIDKKTGNTEVFRVSELLEISKEVLERQGK